MELLTRPRPPLPTSPPRPQRGVVLFVTLIILILMTLATIAVVRSMDTSNLIAGNFAFKQAAMQASDRAITDAMNNLANITLGSGGNTDIADRYSNVVLTTVDARGVPTAIDWTKVPCRDEANAACNVTTDVAKYRVQYFIERRCYATPDLGTPQSIKDNCDYEESGTTVAVRYRVIIRVLGPRNTAGMYEVMVSGPAST